MPVLLQAADLPGGYGVSLLQTLLALAAVCILAWVVLRWSARRGLGVSRGRVKVLERVPLDGRRALYLIEVNGRQLLVGVGDGGAPALLTELEVDDLPVGREPVATFGDLVRRLRPEPPVTAVVEDPAAPDAGNES